MYELERYKSQLAFLHLDRLRIGRWKIDDIHSRVYAAIQ